MTIMIPTDPELFRIEGDIPVLLLSRCERCSESFFPRRWECPICLGPLSEIEATGDGTLYSHTYVSVPMFGKQRRDGEGYGVGQVDLDGGVRVQTVLTGEPETWKIGGRFTAHLEAVTSGPDSGPARAIFRFRPVD